MKQKNEKSYKKQIIFGITCVFIVFLFWLFFFPFNPQNVAVIPNPATSYDDALARIAASNERDNDKIRPECQSFAETQGKKTAKVIVVYHGYTNCPIQFKELAGQLKAEGYNVLVMRMPGHGDKDRNNNTLKDVTEKELAEYANNSVDIARGLGDEPIVTGLSVGGGLTTWVAQSRNDVKYIMPMAPFYAPKNVPFLLIKPMIRTMNILPPINIWWDNKTKENNVTGSPYAYAGFDTHSLAKFLSFGVYYDQLLDNKKSKDVQATLVVNSNDTAINNFIAERNLEKASNVNDANYQKFQFAKKYGLDHDIIDPYNPKQNTKYVYPIIINLINNISQ